jgi:hypothetical protein
MKHIVYCVDNGEEYSDHMVLGIFSSMENAQSFVVDMNKKYIMLQVERYGQPIEDWVLSDSPANKWKVEEWPINESKNDPWWY